MCGKVGGASALVQCGETRGPSGGPAPFLHDTGRRVCGKKPGRWAARGPCALSECSVPGRSAEAGREGEEATAREDVVTGQMALREGDAGPSSWTWQGADGRPSPSPRRPYRT